MKTFIIAEAGANHNRNFKQAQALIDIAVKAKANAVKFQTYSSDTLYSKNTPDFAGYKNINQLIKDIELPREWQKDLKQYCDEVGIEFMSTPFDEKAVDELVALGVKRLKIAGFESTDFRFINMVASSKMPLIISLGIGFKINELNKIFEITSRYNNDLTLLHCNNAYPTPINEAGLETIKTLLLNTNCKIGYSDHTTSILTPSLAVAIGATVIEKHFTLSRYLPGPDHPFALEPNELNEMIELIRQTEQIMIPQLDEYTESEKAFIGARRSVVAKCDILVGDLFTENNITTKRPYIDGCIPASEYHNIIGQPSTRNYKIDDLIKY